MLDQRYQKTEAGRAEITARSLTGLSRSGRNLLLMLDASRTAREWLAMVQGATQADLELLLAQDMIAGPAGTAAAAAEAMPPAAASAMPATPAIAASAASAPTAPLGYAELYSYLTRHARQYLGLIKGYRTVLEVERCTDLATLKELAERFAFDVEREHGPATAQQVRQSLGLKP